jgi:hypothetical protein
MEGVDMTAEEVQGLQELCKDSEFLRTSYDRLKAQFENQYIAIKNQKVIDHNTDIDKLINSIRAKNLNPASILIEFLHPRDMVLIL